MTAETAPALDAPRALRLLREVVAERPGYVYEPPEGGDHGCVYVYKGQPSCIVGHVLVRAGWPVETFESHPKINASIARDLSFDNISPQAIDILDAAQAKQDNQEPWSEALAAAEAEAAGLGVTA